MFHVKILLIKYGFTKVRRGPDMDMYAHPRFIRGKKDVVAQLRKQQGSNHSNNSRHCASFDSQESFSASNSVAKVSFSSCESKSRSSSFSSQEGQHMIYTKKVKQQSCLHNVSYKHPTDIPSSYDEISSVSNQHPRCNKLALLTFALTSLADVETL